MAKPMRRYTMPQSWQGGTEEPETNTSVPQQEKQPDAAEGKVIIDYNPDVDYEGSEPKNEPVAWEEKEENSDTEYANIEMH